MNETLLPLPPPWNLLIIDEATEEKMKKQRVCETCYKICVKASRRAQLRKKFIAKYRKIFNPVYCFDCRRIIGRKKVYKPAVKRKEENEIIPKLLMRQWKNIMEGKKKEDLLLIGDEVIMLYSNKNLYSEMLYNYIFGVYRTVAEWRIIMEYLRNRLVLELPEDGEPSLKHKNPFFFGAFIADHISKLITFNAKCYCTVVNGAARRLVAKLDQRVVGEIDLSTTIRIPEKNMVSVYDFPSRTKYVFHTNTILKSILSALKYCALGVAKPMPPKNPYTNLEWTRRQLISISQQIIRNMTYFNRIPPAMFLNYFKAGFCLHDFRHICGMDLGLNAARELFADKESLYLRSIYTELLDDMLNELGYGIGLNMRKSIIERNLTESLQKRWDDLILAIWIYTNLNYLVDPYISYSEICNDFEELYDETRTQRRIIARAASNNSSSSGEVLRVSIPPT